VVMNHQLRKEKSEKYKRRLRKEKRTRGEGTLLGRGKQELVGSVWKNSKRGREGDPGGRGKLICRGGGKTGGETGKRRLGREKTEAKKRDETHEDCEYWTLETRQRKRAQKGDLPNLSAGGKRKHEKGTAVV